jgi:hypothetical protein
MKQLLCVAVVRQLLLLFWTMLIGMNRTPTAAMYFHCEAADTGGNSVQECLYVPVTEQRFTAFAAVQAAENVVFRLPRRYRGSGAKDSSRIGVKTAAKTFGHDFAAVVTNQAVEAKD